METKLNELLLLIRELANKSVYRYENLENELNEVRKLTKCIWEDYYSELILSLEELGKDVNKDYQLFWFECLKYPLMFPELKDLKGINLNMRYESLPSQFNELYFHDSIIDEIVVDKHLVMTLDLIDTWHDEKMGWRQKGRGAKLVFKNIHSIHMKKWLETSREYEDVIFEEENLNGQIISDFAEVPSITYAFRDLEIAIKEEFKTKRVFLLEGFFDGWNRVIIICDGWNIERFGEEHDIGYAFRANG